MSWPEARYSSDVGEEGKDRRAEKLRRFKNSRRGFLAAITTKQNETNTLIKEDKNIKSVKERLVSLDELFLKFTETHDTIHRELEERSDILESLEYFSRKKRSVNEFTEGIQAWITAAESRNYLLENVEVNPEDSVSQVGSRTSVKSFRRSHPGSLTSSISVARTKEATRKAELKAEAVEYGKTLNLERERLMMRQEMEQKELKLIQDEKRVYFEREIAKAEAKEQVLAELEADGRDIYSERSKEQEPEESKFARFRKGQADNIYPRFSSGDHQFGAKLKTSGQAMPMVGQPEIFSELLYQQNSLREQQNEMMKLFSSQLLKSSLPKPQVPVFGGNPLEYFTFIRAFENLIESKTTSNMEKLYYLEQYTTNEVQELVRSCHYLNPDRGYGEARRLLKKKYGDSYKIATAYIDRALSWPTIKAEDGEALHKFSVYLSGCKNTMEGNDYMQQFNHPENLKKLIRILPFSMRARWRCKVDEIMEEKFRPVDFNDLVDFVNREARIITNPVYGNIIDDWSAKPPNKERRREDKYGTRSGFKSSSFGVQAEEVSGSQEYVNPDDPTDGQSINPQKCLFCNEDHQLDYCSVLRGKPYKDRIYFLMEKRLCFGCLSTGHIARECPCKSRCKVRTCLKPHPTILHVNPDIVDEMKEVHNGYVSTEAKKSADTLFRTTAKIAMAVIPVKVWTRDRSKVIRTYAFLDNGSNASFCTESLMNQLGVYGLKTQISLTTMEKKDSLVDSYVVQGLDVSDLDENNFIGLPMLYTKPEIPVTTQDVPTQEDIERWHHLQGIHIPSIDAEVGLLIACDVPEALDPIEVRHSQDGGPYASRSRLGWSINGPLGRHEVASKHASFFVKADVQLHQMVSNYFKQDFNDSIADESKAMSQEDRQFLSLVQDATYMEDGHYVIPLPYKDVQRPMPNNKPQAVSRANQLKRKLQKDPKRLQDYKSFISDLLVKGYARKVPPENLERCDGKVWYLPHHGVYHPHKPEKIRVVFDCSAKYRGVSLNDVLLKGPDLTNPLTAVLTKFRQESVATMADVEAMFHQVKVYESDCDSLRFLWWPEGELTREVEEYQMTVHIFGAVSSPSCANFALRKTATDHIKDFNTTAVETILKNFYVDDCLKSLPTVDESTSNVYNVRELLSKGGFKLTKWTSNSLKVLESIPKDDLAKGVREFDLSKDVVLPVERALGVKWQVESDEFGFNIIVKDRPSTRRGILSVISSIYDPLGFAAPFSLTAKLILQNLCRGKLGWDEEVPKEYLNRWLKWTQDLPKLSQLSIDRCIKPSEFGEIQLVQLHVFADASEIGYGAVAYLRVVSKGRKIHCSFLIGKSRLAPLKPITIPRLELSAAVVAARLYKMMERDLDIEIDETILWTDSTSVLRYVENDSKRFKTFVANRIAILREISSPQQWRHVDSKSNPADEASRGLSVTALLSDSRWLKGPEFLWETEDCWPKRPPSMEREIIHDLEIKEEVTTCASNVEQSVTSLQKSLEIFSSWYHLKKIVAWILRLRSNLLERCKLRKENKRSRPQMSLQLISVKEIEKADEEILKYVQRNAFPDEIRALKAKPRDDVDGGTTSNRRPTREVAKSSSISKLDPFLTNGLLRVGGRLSQASLSEETRHQIILPKNAHVTTLIIQHYHRLSGHSGRQYVLALLREKYWVIKANSTVRKVLGNCYDCRRRQTTSCQQKMADLPIERVTADRPPFTAVGVDYFGPFHVKRGRSLVKRYGAIFICLAVRAVHIEIAQSLDTDSFLLALRRFIARRGQVKEIRSDNGTNFLYLSSAGYKSSQRK